jgi:excinuclease ABC subunit C
VIDLSALPTTPGIYIYRNSAGEIIYVGKAINLKKRVSQYFQRDDALGPKTATLVSQIASIETKTVGSEIEALILEASYIKKYRPRYNSLLKDDRSYSFIILTRDKFPLVYSTHLSQIPAKADVFGPFPSGTDVNRLLKTIRRIFPYYTKKHGPRPCLYCHLGLCPGPNVSQSDYHQTIIKIKKILNGKFSLLRRQLVKEMDTSTKLQNFETSLVLRRQIESLDYVVSGWKNLNNLFEQINLPEDKQSSAINELITTLNPYLNIHSLKRLECFDISQMGTKYFVGSMVVWLNGQIDKSQYRKFKIRNVIASAARQSRSEEITANDAYMIKEVIWRRLRHPEWGSPDLIIVDGGKPQLSAAVSITQLPTIGLAKRLETIVLKSNNDFVEINLPVNSHALQLLQSLRNEAHRFANRYRTDLMKKSISDH